MTIELNDRQLDKLRANRVSPEAATDPDTLDNIKPVLAIVSPATVSRDLERNGAGGVAMPELMLIAYEIDPANPCEILGLLQTGKRYFGWGWFDLNDMYETARKRGESTEVIDLTGQYPSQMQAKMCAVLQKRFLDQCERGYLVDNINYEMNFEFVLRLASIRTSSTSLLASVDLAKMDEQRMQEVRPLATRNARSQPRTAAGRSRRKHR